MVYISLLWLLLIFIFTYIYIYSPISIQFPHFFVVKRRGLYTHVVIFFIFLSQLWQFVFIELICLPLVVSNFNADSELDSDAQYDQPTIQ